MAKALTLRNTEYSYGLIAILLHWIVAAAFIVNYGLIYYREWFTEPRSDEGRALFSHHTTIGISVLCLLYTSPSPRDQRGSRMPSSA